MICPAGMGEMFQRRVTAEARILAKLQHPSIVTIYELGQGHGRLAVLRARAGRWDLAARSARRAARAGAGRRQPRTRERLELLSNLVAIAEALAYAHERKRRPSRLHAEQHHPRQAWRGDADRLGHRARSRCAGRRGRRAAQRSAAVDERADGDDQRGHAAVPPARAEPGPRPRIRASTSTASASRCTRWSRARRRSRGSTPRPPASATSSCTRSSTGSRPATLRAARDAARPRAVRDHRPRDGARSRRAVHRRRAGPRAQAVPDRRPRVLASLLGDRPAVAVGAPAQGGVGRARVAGRVRDRRRAGVGLPVARRRSRRPSCAR